MSSNQLGVGTDHLVDEWLVVVGSNMSQGRLQWPVASWGFQPDRIQPLVELGVQVWLPWPTCWIIWSETTVYHRWSNHIGLTIVVPSRRSLGPFHVWRCLWLCTWSAQFKETACSVLAWQPLAQPDHDWLKMMVLSILEHHPAVPVHQTTDFLTGRSQPRQCWCQNFRNEKPRSSLSCNQGEKAVLFWRHCVWHIWGPEIVPPKIRIFNQKKT